MPPKRLTTAPVYTLNSNVLMHEISKRLKTENAARLSIALGSRKVPGLSKAVKALNTQRKEDAVRVAKARIHGIARRVVTVMCCSLTGQRPHWGWRPIAGLFVRFSLRNSSVML